MVIIGNWVTRQVTINGFVLSPKESLRIWNHSPDGFNWGYHGSGPAQLALAILLAAGANPEQASRLHQRFKFEVIARLPQGNFDITIDVQQWLEDAEREIAALGGLIEFAREAGELPVDDHELQPRLPDVDDE